MAPLSDEDKQRIREEEEFRQSVRNEIDTPTESYLDRVAKNDAQAKLGCWIFFAIAVGLLLVFGGGYK